MIITFLITGLMSLVTTIFGVLPSLPAVPTAISSGASWITDQISAVSGLFQLIYGSALWSGIFVVIVAIFLFETVYHTTMWVIRKVPFINVK